MQLHIAAEPDAGAKWYRGLSAVAASATSALPACARPSSICPKVIPALLQAWLTGWTAAPVSTPAGHVAESSTSHGAEAAEAARRASPAASAPRLMYAMRTPLAVTIDPHSPAGSVKSEGAASRRPSAVTFSHTSPPLAAVPYGAAWPGVGPRIYVGTGTAQW